MKKARICKLRLSSYKQAQISAWSTCKLTFHISMSGLNNRYRLSVELLLLAGANCRLGGLAPHPAPQADGTHDSGWQLFKPADPPDEHVSQGSQRSCFICCGAVVVQHNCNRHSGSKPQHRSHCQELGKHHSRGYPGCVTSTCCSCLRCCQVSTYHISPDALRKTGRKD